MAKGASKRGTAHHVGHEVHLNHIAWLVGVFSDIVENTDQNRFIELELVKPSDERFKAWVEPSHAEAAEIGFQMLALSIAVARQAILRQKQLDRLDMPDIDRRVIKNLSIPAAFLATAWDMDE